MAEIPPLRLSAELVEMLASIGLRIQDLHDLELEGTASGELFVITYTGRVFIHPRQGVIKGTACVCTCEHTAKERQA